MLRQPPPPPKKSRRRRLWEEVRALVPPDARKRAARVVRRMLEIEDVPAGGGHVSGAPELPDAVSVTELYRKRPDRREDGSVPLRPIRARYSGPNLPVLRAHGAGKKGRRFLSDVELLDPEGAATPQGVIGTPYEGGIPAMESLQEMRPHQARGLSSEPGNLERFYRGDTVVFNAVNQSVDMLCGATWEAVVPEIDDRFEGLIQFDRDAVQRMADYVNAELHLNPHVDYVQVRREQVQAITVKGFALHEATLDVNAPMGRKLTSLEFREPITIEDWILTDRQQLVGFTQSTSLGSGLRVSRAARTAPAVDIRRCLFSTNLRTGANYEGIAGIRPAYFWHKLAVEFARSGLLHRQRFGAGFPVFRLTSGVADSSKAVEGIHQAATEFFYAKNAYMRLPEGVLFEILQLQQEAGLVPIWEYTDRKKREALGAMVFAIGQGPTGSFALADVQSLLYLKRQQGFVGQIERGHDAVIKLLVDAQFGEQAVYPVMAVRGVLKRSDAETIQIWRQYAETVKIGREAGALDDEDIRDLRQEIDAIPNLIEEDESAGDAEEAPTDAEVADAIVEQMPSALAKRARARVVILGRDGKEFVTFRPLSEIEAHCAFRTLSDEIDDSRDRIVRQLDKVGREHRRRFIELANPLIEGGDLEQLATLSADFRDRYFDVLQKGLEGVSEFVRSDMLAEVASQVGETPPVRQGEPRSPGLRAQVDSQAMLLAGQIADRFEQRLRVSAIQVANGGRRGVLQALTPSASFSLFVSVQQALTTTTNETRSTVAGEEGPRVVKAIYSAVLDGAIPPCPVCGPQPEGLDGTTYVFGSAAYEKNKPPNPNCRGIETLKSMGNPCRCIYIYQFETASGAEVEQGSDEDRAELDTRAADVEAASVVRILCGPPCAGKSTLAATYAGDGTVISLDDLIFQSVDKWTHERSLEAASAAMALIGAALERGDTTIVLDAPLVSRAARKRVIEGIRAVDEDRKYRIECVAVTAGIDTLQDRNSKRAGRRNMSDKAIRAMWRAFTERPPTRADGFDAVTWIRTDEPSGVDT